MTINFTLYFSKKFNESYYYIPFISSKLVSGTSLPSSASCNACRLAYSSSPTTTTTARLLKPSNGRILRRWADGNTIVCHNAHYYKNRSHKLSFCF